MLCVKYLFHYSATYENGQWKYAGAQADARGPFNPWHSTHKPAAAYLAVTRNGHLRFAYQTPEGRWHDIKHELDDVSTSDEILTHAAFSTNEGASRIFRLSTEG